MRTASDLRRRELEAIVDSIQGYMYLDLDQTGREFWNPLKPWEGADLCEHLAGLLDEYGLVPEARQPADARCFVLYDFDAGHLATTNVYAAYQQAADDAVGLDNVIILKLAAPAKTVPAIEENP